MEMNNRELDELIDTIGQWIMEDEDRPKILNPFRLAQIRFTHTVLEKMAKGTDMKVSTTLHEPFNSMGSICIEGDFLDFGDCKWLGRAIELASNVEIFPIRDGKIRLVLTFHGLTKPLKTK